MYQSIVPTMSTPPPVVAPRAWPAPAIPEGPEGTIRESSRSKFGRKFRARMTVHPSWIGGWKLDYFPRGSPDLAITVRERPAARSDSKQEGYRRMVAFGPT